MRYLSVFSGIEAASVAWEGLGWTPVAFSEIDPFPCAVLAHRFPNVPNWGDITKYKEWPERCTCVAYGTTESVCNVCGGVSVDLIVGGSPCQAFSIAGLRKGLDDPRGNLMLTYLGVVEKYKPKWVVWENVPGVLSSNGGRDFGTFLGALGNIGYGFAYRVLDTQFTRTREFPRAIPQRRRRVFVVGSLGDWRRACAVLLNRQSLSGDSAPGRTSQKSASGAAADGSGTSGKSAGLMAYEHHPMDSRVKHLDGACTTVNAKYRKGDTPLVTTQSHWSGGTFVDVERSVGTLNARDFKGVGSQFVDEGKLVVYENHPQDSRVKEMGDVCTFIHAKYGTGGGNVPLVAESLLATDYKGPGHNRDHNFVSVPAPLVADVSITAPSLTASNDPSRSPQSSEVTQQVSAVHQAISAVRRLTPVETERLQGFRDDWTKVPFNGKTAEQCPDGRRYKAIGNSMSTNVMGWIGQRIQFVEEVLSGEGGRGHNTEAAEPHRAGDALQQQG